MDEDIWEVKCPVSIPEWGEHHGETGGQIAGSSGREKSLWRRRDWGLLTCALDSYSS